MKLGIDLDGVIASYQHNYDVHGRAIPGLEWWRPDVFAQATPVPQAIDALSRLKLDGHTIKIITARTVAPETMEWLAMYRVPYDELHHTGAKWNVPCHVYFDDGVRFLNGFHERGLVAVKYRYPHNIDAFAKYEVDNWQGFVDLIHRPIKGKFRKNPRKLGRVS